jgi:carboxyl-terminal processing protease
MSRIASRCLRSRRFLHIGLLVAVAGVCLCPALRADPVSPGPDDRYIVASVKDLLQKQHLSRHPLDKEIAARWMKLFLKSMDPMKLYFYQSDVDEFNQHQDDLVNTLQKNDVSLAYVVFRRFLQRVDERVKMVDDLLTQPQDFTVNEEMVIDRDMLQYPANPGEAQERWRKRIKYDLLALKTEKDKKDKKEGKDAVEKLTNRYHSFAKRMHQTNSDELLEIYLNALTTSFDPHTSYMSPDTQKDFDIMMSLELEGIGASLQTDDSYTVVKHLVPGGAADKDGRLKVEDKIIGVGEGAEGPITDVIDMKIRDVVKLIRGKRGTDVRLKVMPVSGDVKVLKITREKIELKDSEAQWKIFDVGKRPDGSPYKIGVIDLPSFYMDMTGARRGIADFKSTTRDVRAILEEFNRKGVDAVALDLRRNGGGSLTEAINLTGLFIADGPVVQVKDADGTVHPYYDLDPSMIWSGPLLVMTSKFSASASEILAGAIQDYGRGLIVGDHATHGKGTVQSLIDISQHLFPYYPNIKPMGALKVTMQQFYRPNGESTQKRGVLADIELPSLTSHLDVGEADLDYPMEFDRVDPMSFKRFDAVTPSIREQLKRLSEQRVQATDKFQKELRKIARYKEQKAKKSIALNEAQFLKEREDLNADKEEEKTFDELNNPNSKGIVRDYYLDEVMAIAVDYLNLTQLAKAR